MCASEARKPITEEQQQELDDVFERSKKALAIIETYDQARVDRLCQAVAWAVANKRTFARLVDMGIAESGLGDAVSRMGKRMKIPWRPARRPATEERRHHRRVTRERHREVRQAGGNCCLHCSDHESGPYPCGQRDLCNQGTRRRHLFAAPAFEENIIRNGSSYARRIGA